MPPITFPKVTGNRLFTNIPAQSKCSRASAGAPDNIVKTSLLEANIPEDIKYILAMLCSNPQVAKSQMGKNTAATLSIVDFAPLDAHTAKQTSQLHNIPEAKH